MARTEAFNPNRLKQTRELEGLTPLEMAEFLELTEGEYLDIEEGRAAEPDPELLEVLAMRVRFPVSFFYQEDPPPFINNSGSFYMHFGKPEEEDPAWRNLKMF